MIFARSEKMIVKIWGVEGEKGLASSLDYIADKEKMGMDNADKNSIEQAILNTYQDDDLKRTFEYIANEDKIKGTYLSGYLCDPKTAFEEFAIARNQTVMKTGKADSDGKYIAFHIVQSMPENINISDEEVHQCGIELVEKIGAHQAVIASHVHPVVDENTGEISGKCKHNHILLNAYIHPDKLDSRFPNRIRYYDNNTTYAKLQIWNDQIALEHGLPIIANPDLGKTYSWAEQTAIKYNMSWKEHVRMDIDEILYLSNSWDEFVQKMTAKGYEIKQGKHITYVTPPLAGEQKRVRDYKLGRAYTKEALLSFWQERKTIKAEVAHELSHDETEFNDADPISELTELSKMHEKLYVTIPIGNTKSESATLFQLSIDTELSSDVLKTYFSKDHSYDICDAFSSPVAQFNGQDIYDFIRMRQEQEQQKEEINRLSNEKLRKNQDREKQGKKKYYSYHLFINSRTKKPYRIGLYDRTGRRRSNLELMFILAAVVLQKEDKLWNVKNVTPEQENEIYFGKTDVKAQRMMDAIQVARSENISNLSELDERLQSAGAQLSRTRAALNKNKKQKEKMELPHTAIENYLRVKDTVEPIFAMPDGLEKDELLSLHEDEVLSYNKAKAIMYRYKIKNHEDVEDFQARYIKVKNDITLYEEKLNENKEEYRKLKKLNYNASLAEDPRYCYGPAYGAEKEHKKDIGLDIDKTIKTERNMNIDYKINQANTKKKDKTRETEL